MEYWSLGVLHEVRIAPRGRGVGGAEGAEGGPFGAALTVVFVSGQREKHISAAPPGRVFEGPVTRG
jgi:hypothetical protein